MKQELNTLLAIIEENQKKIEAFGKFDKEILKRINYKFRLDWNYHSNKIEGGTLTLEETKNVMASLIKSESAKPKKDFIEMNGHDQQVVDILKLSKGEQRISPKRIREMHKGIMYEDNPEKTTQIGQWKKVNNYILNYKGERFDFLPFSDVPDAIQDLSNWINGEFDSVQRKKGAEHPLIIAAEFHLRYINIHPFYDGNGRTARLLTNIVLVACDYPPIIVKDIQKDEYGKTLAEVQQYGAPATLFYQFMAERLVNSQEIMLKALLGESIEEEDDLEKEFTLLDQQFEALSSENEVKLLLKDIIFDKIINGWYSELMSSVIGVAEKYKRFFLEVEYCYYIQGNEKLLTDPKFYVADLIGYFFECVEGGIVGKDMPRFETKLKIKYHKFKKGGIKEFNIPFKLDVVFESTTYSIILDQFDKGEKEMFSRKVKTDLLSNPLNIEEIKAVSNMVEENMIENMKRILKKVK